MEILINPDFWRVLGDIGIQFEQCPACVHWLGNTKGRKQCKGVRKQQGEKKAVQMISIWLVPNLCKR